jgi:hypothetical protein
LNRRHQDFQSECRRARRRRASDGSLHITRESCAALKAGAKTSAELAEHLGAAIDSVDRTARKLRDKGQLITLPDTRPIKWALPERREA